jgi:hypothetical protein
MKGIKLANNVSAHCLVSGLGHDFVTIYRGDPHGSSESWMECNECHLTLGELEKLESDCHEHKLKCIRCGFPMMKDRKEHLEQPEEPFELP